MNQDDLKKLVGTRLYWVETSNRWVFLRSGVLDTPHRGQICFDGSGDYYPPSHYKRLTTTPHQEEK